MELKKAVRGRRSIRHFKSAEIPEEVIREILNDARWSPSWGNTQPWELFVVTGHPLKLFKQVNRQHLIESVPPAPEIPMPEQWPQDLKDRYIEVGKSVLSSQGIGREDKAARNQYYAEMFTLFSAPCLIVTCIDKSLSLEYTMLDLGLLVQTICLLAYDRGLGTCNLAAAVRYPNVLREIVPIPGHLRIVIGTCLGYPHPDAPVNQFKRERVPLNKVVKWVR